jgi:hypothetical protein
MADKNAGQKKRAILMGRRAGKYDAEEIIAILAFRGRVC